MQRSERRLGSGSGKGAPASPSERRGTSWRAPTGSISFVRHADAFRRRQFAGISARPGDPASGAGAVPALRNDLWGWRLVIWRRPPGCRVASRARSRAAATEARRSVLCKRLAPGAAAARPSSAHGGPSGCPRCGAIPKRSALAWRFIVSLCQQPLCHGLCFTLTGHGGGSAPWQVLTS